MSDDVKSGFAQTPDLIASFDGMSVYRNKDDIGLFFDRSNEGAVSVRISDDVAKELARAVSAALAPGNTAEQMARLSAGEVACYRWPEDTAEHRAMRAAFMDGAALAGNAGAVEGQIQANAIAAYAGTEEADSMFLLSQLRVTPTEQARSAVASFRQQMIVAGAMAFTLKSAPAAPLPATQGDGE